MGGNKMKRLLVSLLLICSILPVRGSADTRYIVRDTLGLLSLKSLCGLLGCSVVKGLDGTLGQVFLITTPDKTNPTLFLSLLLQQFGIVNAELDQVGKVLQSSSGGAPPALYDNTAVSYFGTTVIRGYLNQPAAQIINLGNAQAGFNVDGSGVVVAVIDTGVDPSHPVLQPVLLTGYDFTRNRSGADEKADLNQSTVAVVDGQQPAIVNQSTVAVVDQSTVAVVDQPQYAAFGHGTMVSGVVHLVAPTAKILPLKAFQADGSGYLSDVLQAIYHAVQHDAKVINMSFSIAAYSRELHQATTHASKKGLICVASAGNNGQQVLVYPAAFQGNVMGVASTTNSDQLSSFSNYGQSLVWVGAPGEGIVTTYPWGTWAAAWGTSFSAPFVSGGAALVVSAGWTASETSVAQAIAQAKYISSALGNGRLDLYQALSAWLAGR